MLAYAASLMPYRLTTSGRELIAKNAIPANFPEAQLVTPKQVVFKSEDGLEIHGCLLNAKVEVIPSGAIR